MCETVTVQLIAHGVIYSVKSVGYNFAIHIWCIVMIVIEDIAGSSTCIFFWKEAQKLPDILDDRTLIPGPFYFNDCPDLVLGLMPEDKIEPLGIITRRSFAG